MRDIKKIAGLAVALAVKLVIGLLAVKFSAHLLGPSEFALTGVVTNIAAIIGLIAGGGVSAGLTRAIAASGSNVDSRSGWISASFQLVTAIVILLLLLLFGSFFTWKWFGAKVPAVSEGTLVFTLACAILITAVGAMYQGMINGDEKTRLYSISIALGSAVAFSGLAVLALIPSRTSALVAIIWVSVAQFIALIIVGNKNYKIKCDLSKTLSNFHRDKINNLIGYTSLSAFASCTLPLAYLILRSQIYRVAPAEQVGLWQATVRISEAYSQLPLLFLNSILFARFAAQSDKSKIWENIKISYTQIIVLTGGVCVFVYLTRAWWIPLVFTSGFYAMGDLLPFQLAGDVLRMVAYIGTTALAARGFLKLCILGEILQAVGFVFLGIWLIPLFGVVGALISYCVTYIAYLLITFLMVFSVIRPKK